MKKKLFRSLTILVCINLVFYFTETNYFDAANAAPPKPRFKRPKIKKAQPKINKSNKLSYRKKIKSKIKGRKHFSKKSIKKAKKLEFRKNFEKASQSKGIKNAKNLELGKQFKKAGRKENKSKKTASFGSLTKANA